MSKFTVDSFIVELGFNENVIKGLQRVEKLAMQSAQRIEKNLSKGFRINTKQLDSNLTSSLGQLERRFNKTFDKFEQRARGSDSNLLIVFYVQIMPDDLVMQLHRF